MNREALIEIIKKKQSYLCIGLDSDPAKIPSHLKSSVDPVFEFNKSIIDVTHDLTAAYKLNIAFYESNGIEGWQSLEKTIRYLDTYKDVVFTIADAKRGDIGNTSAMYAKAFLATPPHGLGFNAITVSPFMGKDSVLPFFTYQDKWVVLLALTSNEGARDFQNLKIDQKEQLFEHVIKVSKEWGNTGNLMYVVGATKAEMLTNIRTIIPDHFLLIPGVGAQGGSLKEVSRFGLNKDCGLLINSSRGIIFASSGKNFAEKARQQAEILQRQMSSFLKEIW
ncbi:MAG: orotidine-5'-phosphate decarboxylase [Sphingobacteriia bacterium]|nr:orotidine-5'-phosphate decarboxylase [Sphingobacteriia bacterium]